MGIHGWNSKEAVRKFDAASKVFARSAGDAVREHTDDVFAATQVRVPRLTGALAATGHVEEVVEFGPDILLSRAIHYGDSDIDGVGVDYAAAVHERLGVHHKPPTGPKYVEQPLLESIPNFAEKTMGKMREAKKEVF